jgi:putative ABC transport system permease protein
VRRAAAFFKRLSGWRGRAARERDLRDELEAHLQLHVDDNIRAGMSPAEARRQAALRFGSVDAAKEEVRSQWTVAWIESTRQDLGYAFRAFRRNPAFAATAIVSLALGIGASVAVFTVADGVLLRPLPYPNSGQLMMLWERQPHGGETHNLVNPGNFRAWQQESHAFADMAIVGYGIATLVDRERAEEFPSRYVPPEFFSLLGVKPWRGRFFTPAECVLKSPDVFVISYHLWQTWFGGDEAIVGRRIQLSTGAGTIVGVLPPGFYFRNRAVELFGNLQLDPSRKYYGDGRWLTSVARLNPGVTQAQAQAEMDVIAHRLELAEPNFDKGWGVTVESLRDSMTREVKRPLLVLLGAVLFVLAVACANVANLLLARFGARRREMSVRAAIGAGRWRLARQLLTESIVLGVTGGVLGVLLARWAVSGLLALAPRDLVRNTEIALDLRVLAVAVALSLVSAIAFGLLPSLLAARRDPLSGLKEGSRGSTGGHTLARRWLVAVEVAFSVMLLAGAGLMFRTVTRLQSVDPGLNPERVLTFRVTLPRARFHEYPPRLNFFNRAFDQLRGLPGVQSVSMVDPLPFGMPPPATWVTVAGRPPAAPGDHMVTVARIVMPGYFRTIGIPIKAGRAFTDADNTPESPLRFVISESFARQYLVGENPIGKRIWIDWDRPGDYGEIIGVAGDVREGAVDQPAQPTTYYVHAHRPTSEGYFVMKTAGDPLALAASARHVIHGLEPEQPVMEMESMENIVRETFSRQRFTSVLLAGFSLVALVLAAVGIYGVLAYSVTERTREFGVRIALGAAPSRILSQVLAGGARLVFAGTVVGIAGALALTQLLQSLLYEVGPRDPVTFVGVPMVLAAVGLLAAWIPARRASRLPAIDALRAE